MPTQPELRVINTGEHANDGTGDTLRAAAEKINANFDDVYSALGITGGSATFVNSIIEGYGIHVNHASGNVTVSYNAPKFENVVVAGQDTITADTIHSSLTVVAGDLITVTTNASGNALTITAIDPRTIEGGATDWDAVSGPTRILNKPAIFSGNYNDLTNLPNIPAAQVASDWNSSSGLSKILNKPSVTEFQADWLNGDTGTLGFIKNKPFIATAIGDLADTNKQLLPDAAYYVVTTPSIAPGTTATIYTASAPLFGAVKATIVVGISDGAGGSNAQAVEMLIIINEPASGDPVPDVLMTSPLYTGGSSFCTFAATWDTGANRLAITLTNTGSTTSTAKVTAIEYN